MQQYKNYVHSIVMGLLAVYKDVRGEEAYRKLLSDLKSGDQATVERAMDTLTLSLQVKEVEQAITNDLITEISLTL